MRGTSPRPAKFEFEQLSVGPVQYDQADVATDVAGAWRAPGHRTEADE